MYCERQEDCHHLEVSGMLMKAEFLDFKRSLHLADNNALNKFAKGRLLFNAIAFNCLIAFNL